MVDTASLKASVDLLELLRPHVPLRKVARTNGGEFAGPCPFCGGRDRFRVWPAKWRWWCRQCERKGDAIAFVQQLYKVGFRDACDRLGCPSNGSASSRVGLGYRKSPVAKSGPLRWQELGLQLVEKCESGLWSAQGIRARRWLHQRGLRDETLRQWRIGYCPIDCKARGIRMPVGILLPNWKQVRSYYSSEKPSAIGGLAFSVCRSSS